VKNREYFSLPDILLVSRITLLQFSSSADSFSFFDMPPYFTPAFLLLHAFAARRQPPLRR